MVHHLLSESFLTGRQGNTSERKARSFVGFALSEIAVLKGPQRQINQFSRTTVRINDGPLVKRLRQRPLTPLTWVRFPYGSPFSLILYPYAQQKRFIVGVDCNEVPPVPIPNTEVKLICADNTWRATAREDK